MLLRQIKYFMAVVDFNSFTEAAEYCYISQSAISQQIRALEKEIGVELLKRENKKFILTSAGEYFYKNGKRLLDDAEKICRETVKLGSDDELQLKIGYLRCYNGSELNSAIAMFAERYPEVAINIVNGTHEELYDLLRFGSVDLVLNDQRRAFSDLYINYQLIESDCCIEISSRNNLANGEHINLEDLKNMPCILITSEEQQANEQEFYKSILGFEGDFIFAKSPEEGRLMVVGNRGFMPVEKVGTFSETGFNIARLPLYRQGKSIKRNYCAFWKKEKTNYYIEEFANILYGLLHKI